MKIPKFFKVSHVSPHRQGEALLPENALQVLDALYPELEKKIMLHILDEKSRRVGQSVAAASMPYMENNLSR